MKSLNEYKNAREILDDWIKKTDSRHSKGNRELFDKECDLIDPDIVDLLVSNSDNMVLDIDRIFRIQIIRLLKDIKQLLSSQTKISNNSTGNGGNGDDNI